MGRDKLRQHEASQDQQRTAVLAEARALEQQDRVDEAERVIERFDSSIQGGVAIAAMYQERLKRLAAERADKERIRETFVRARNWAWRCYPEPHTEIEAEAVRAGCAEAVARLAAIIGYEPAEPAA